MKTTKIKLSKALRTGDLVGRWSELRGLTSNRSHERSLQELVRLLHSDSEFATVNRATVSRWTQGIGDPVRIRRAVEHLERVTAGSPPIRIGGLHPGPEGLPLWFIEPEGSGGTSSVWADIDCGNSYRIGDKCHLNATIHWFKTGGAALAALEEGEVHVAIASRAYAELAVRAKTVRRLCSICEMPIGVITQNPLQGAWMLENVVIGIQSRTALPQVVRAYLRAMSVRNPLIREFEPDVNPAAIFRSGAVGALVGTPPWLHQLDKDLKTMDLKHDFQPNRPFFGTTEIDLFVRLDTTDPATVRTLLLALMDAISLINAQKHSISFQRTVKALMRGPALKDVIDMLAAYTFCVDKLDVETAIQLWTSELHRDHERLGASKRQKLPSDNGAEL